MGTRHAALWPLDDCNFVWWESNGRQLDREETQTRLADSGTQRARDRPLFIPELYRLRVVSPCRSLPWRFRMKDGALYNIFFSPWFILPSQWVDVSLAFLFRQLKEVTVFAVVARSLLDATSAVSISSQVFPVRFSSSLSLFILLIFPLSFSLRPSVTR